MGFCNNYSLESTSNPGTGPGTDASKEKQTESSSHVTAVWLFCS